MARPYGTKNIMRTPEEKEKLVLEYLNSKEGYRRIAENNDVHPSIFLKWIHQYREKGIEGLKSKTGKHNNPKCGRYNRNKSEVEKLKEELLKKEIEIMRLKKGYLVKGVGAKKGIRYYIRYEYQIIEYFSKSYSISYLCRLLDVSKSGYYKWRYRKVNPCLKEITRQSDLKLIKEIHQKHKSHGYRWINRYIRNKYGIIYTDNYVHRLCKYEDIKYQGKHYQWKKTDEEHEKFNNLIWNGWKYLSKPFEVIVSDMTAFWANKTYYELTLYFDAWNKEIVGYGLSSRKGDTQTYFDGLNQVLDKIKEEKHDDLVILHTDQGSVYSSKTYNNLLNEFNIKHSMSRAGTPTDNPVNESLNGWIKEELFIDFDLKHSKDIPNLIKLYIDYYNFERPSYSLNYKTPIQYKIESGF